MKHRAIPHHPCSYAHRQALGKPQCTKYEQRKSLFFPARQHQPRHMKGAQGVQRYHEESLSQDFVTLHQLHVTVRAHQPDIPDAVRYTADQQHGVAFNGFFSDTGRPLHSPSGPHICFRQAKKTSEFGGNSEAFHFSIIIESKVYSKRPSRDLLTQMCSTRASTVVDVGMLTVLWVRGVNIFSLDLDQVEDGAHAMPLQVLVKHQTVRFRKLFSCWRP